MVTKILNWLYKYLGLICCCCLFGYYLTAYPYTTNLELDQSAHYPLFAVCSGVFLNFLIWSVVDEEDFSLFRICYIVVIVFFLLLSYYDSPILYSGNEHLYNLYCAALAGYIFLFHVEGRLIKYFLYFIIVSAAVEIGKAYLQVFADHGSIPLSLAITGYFDNSAALSVFLVATFPIIVYCVIVPAGHRFGKWVSIGGYLLITLLILGLLAITVSRTSILTLMVINGLMGLSAYGRAAWVWVMRHKALTAFIGIIIIGFGLWAIHSLYHLKYQSAEGRMLIWEVCWQHIKDRPLLGTGPGTFSYWYPQWQAEYFQTHHKVPTAYFLSAGETINAFNEYVQLLCEVGILRMLLLAGSLFIFFRSSNGHPGERLAWTLKITVAAILISGFTFYSFHCTPLLMLLVLFVLKGSYDADSSIFLRSDARLRYPILVVISALVLFCGVKNYSQVCAIANLTIAENMHNLSPAELSALERDVSINLSRDGKALTRMGMVLLEYGELPRAKQCFSDSHCYYRGYQNSLQLANCYAEEGDYANALNRFRYLSYYLPSKFGPRYEQMKLLQRMNRHVEAKNVAKYIITMPVKIPSPTVTRIKEEARLFIEGKTDQ
ncbi:O-antigen ligase family protein [Chitinophaga agri]|uniref:O-antigen ligase family protein n=1 Tax=Chitinophaga agri TaxID=2703787 RepID=A0A6B9ZMQ2_9BACT|nr:O-antigen ligase family protein [Chitinophaga agri]QHS63528.1 O-antigen ligase family protein [Chitinophaga agri]